MDVSRETFEQSDNSTQNLLLFDSLRNIDQKLDAFNAGCTSKHEKLDKDIVRSGRINKAISSGSGLLGGAFAVIASKVFGITI